MSRSPSDGAGQPGTPSFAHALLRTARSIEEQASRTEIGGLEQGRWEIANSAEAAQAVLLHVATTSVRSAPELLTGRAGEDEAGWAVTFLFFCALPLAARLRREGVELDADDAVLRASAVLLRSYGQERFTRIALGGRERVRQLIRLPDTHPVAKWSEAVAMVVADTVESGDLNGFQTLGRLHSLLVDGAADADGEG